MTVLVQVRRTHITIFIITIIVGFLLVTQWRGQRATSNTLKSQTEQDLGQIVRELTFEADVLQTEVNKLRFNLHDYERKAADKKAILSEAQENLQNLKITSGLIAVEGPGLMIIMSDKKRILSTPDFLDLIQELKVAGAEGMSINKKRLSANTYFRKKKSTIYINRDKISPPYEIKAIGKPDLLYQAITLAGGIKDRLDSLEGVTLKTAKRDKVTLSRATPKGKSP